MPRSKVLRLCCLRLTERSIDLAAQCAATEAVGANGGRREFEPRFANEGGMMCEVFCCTLRWGIGTATTTGEWAGDGS
jgi:hypothetical protein